MTADTLNSNNVDKPNASTNPSTERKDLSEKVIFFRWSRFIVFDIGTVTKGTVWVLNDLYASLSLKVTRPQERLSSLRDFDFSKKSIKFKSLLFIQFPGNSQEMIIHSHLTCQIY